jgi:hypothetical protein
VLVSSCALWSTKSLMIVWPLTVSRSPSSDVMKKVYVCVNSGTITPVQRIEKVSTPMLGSGDPAP